MYATEDQSLEALPGGRVEKHLGEIGKIPGGLGPQTLVGPEAVFAVAHVLQQASVFVQGFEAPGMRGRQAAPASDALSSVFPLFVGGERLAKTGADAEHAHLDGAQ